MSPMQQLDAPTSLAGCTVSWGWEGRVCPWLAGSAEEDGMVGKDVESLNRESTGPPGEGSTLSPPSEVKRSPSDGEDCTSIP